MPGKATAVQNGDELVQEVVKIAKALGLETKEQFHVARRIWGANRKIDVILIEGKSRKTLGVECKFQATGGSAEEKIPATIQDIEAWPIPGIVVFSGEGITENMKSYLISTGKAIELNELEPWLRLFFGLPLTSG
jgi:hypothetical protein